MNTLELYGTASCQYTAQLREDLEFRHEDFVEYDVENDPDALVRMLELCEGNHTVPVLVSNGTVVQVGYEGRGGFAGLRS